VVAGVLGAEEYELPYTYSGLYESASFFLSQTGSIQLATLLVKQKVDFIVKTLGSNSKLHSLVKDVYDAIENMRDSQTYAKSACMDYFKKYVELRHTSAQDFLVFLGELDQTAEMCDRALMFYRLDQSMYNLQAATWNILADQEWLDKSVFLPKLEFY
jgi:hypothetical protein